MPNLDAIKTQLREQLKHLEEHGENDQDNQTLDQIMREYAEAVRANRSN